MRTHHRCLLLVALLVALFVPLSAGCGGDVRSTTGSGGSGTTGAGAGQPTGGGGSAGSSTNSGGDSSGSGGSGGTGGFTDLSLGCKGEPPAGATLAPAAKPYSGGMCPVLPMVTTEDITLDSGGAPRKLWLVVPEELAADEQLPVIFLWHWLGGDAKSFFEKAEVQAAVNEQRFLAVIPQKKGDTQFSWPYSVIDSAERLEEEAVFFDDMLACVSEQFKINSNCVSSTGVSAGALFTGQLAGVRGEYLASITSLSGGTGGQYIQPWKPAAHKMPAMVLWGGDKDLCVVIDFKQTSQDLESHLISDGHFFLECIHNCGHSVPPFDAPEGFSRYKSMWQFSLDHPYWAKPGESPYNQSGLPGDLPDWCGIGKDSATPRVGECLDGSGC